MRMEGQGWREEGENKKNQNTKKGEMKYHM